MNRIFRLIWSRARHAWVVVSEKVAAGGALPAITVGGLVGAVLLAAGRSAWALPTGGSLVAGQVSVGSPAAGQMTINQTGNRAVINWQSFGIGQGESVTISQPSSSSALLNRVVGGSASEIFGSLIANGQVFLINPNGVLFGRSASVNVGGLVASSLNIRDTDFLTNSLKFFKDGAAGGVVNRGSISAGFAALLGPRVENSGSIVATLGGAALGAADSITLNFDSQGLIALKLDKGASGALVENSGVIEADGGRILLTAKSADAILKSMVNTSGTLRARTVEQRGGEILLLGDMENGTVKVGGTLDASAEANPPKSPFSKGGLENSPPFEKGGSGGISNGGFVETSGAHVKIADGVKVTTLGVNGGKSGTWLIDPQDYTIAASGGDISGATLSANLGLGNVEIQSASGGTVGHGDINVNDAVSWSANNLTLTAARDININAVMTAGGTSSLTMNTGTANGGDAGVPGGAVNFGFHPGYNGTVGYGYIGQSFAGRLDFPGRSGTGFLTINGQDYSVIQTPAQLAAIGGNLAGHYALGGDVELSYSWTPLGVDQDTPFTGAFTGLGHVVWRPSVYGPANFHGLFGFSNGTLENVQIFMDQYSYIGGADFVGALAGVNDTGGIVRNVVAMTEGTSITGSGQYVGGLVGANSGTILNSHVVPYGNEVYSGAAIHGAGVVGGLVGYNEGAIYNSSASFLHVGVYGSSPTVGFGGLAGINNGAIANSYASGEVTPNKVEWVGGLVGAMEYSNASIVNSYATGTVGSLAVDPAWNDSVVGGLVGYMNGGSITNSYTTAAVVGSNTGGGLVGWRNTLGTTVANSFWDTANYATSDGGTGTTFANLTRASTFAGWDISATGGSSAIWRIYDGLTTPLLRSFLMPLTVTPAFDGSGAALGTIAAYTTRTPYAASAAPLLGIAPTTLTLSSSAPDAYTATLDNTLYSTQLGYDIGYAPRTIATPGSAAGDIKLTAPIIWNSGTLAINTPGTVTAAAIDGTGSAVFDLRAGTWNQVGGTLPAFSVTDFRLSGGVFIRAKGGDGSAGNPYQLADIYGVQGIGSSNALLGKSYTLANDIDASGTSSWNGGAGFNPVGTNMLYFSGRLDGANYVITGLNINRPTTDMVGLFNALTYGSSVVNLGLLNPRIKGRQYVGGLVGGNDSAIITGSYVVNGLISGQDTVGGLVGLNLMGLISGSYVRDTMVAHHGSSPSLRDNFGGLVGWNDDGQIANSYVSDGAIFIPYSGGSNAGGLVGLNTGSISNSYATGALDASYVVGGLVGKNASGASIVNSYATANVSGFSPVGGLVADNQGTVTNSFWNINYWPDPGAGTGKTPAQLMQAATFTGWDISADGGSSSVWRIYEGQSMPLLRSFLTPLTVTANSGSRVYDGTTNGLGVTYSATPNANLLGSLGIVGAGRNAGNYTLTPGGLFSNQQGYDISYVGGALTITPASLTISTGNVTKTYDGTTGAAGAAVAAGGTQLFGGDTLSGGTFAFTDKNVGAGKTVTVSGVTVNDGNGGSNYTVAYADNTASSIAKATLTMNAVSDSKTYDGTQTSGGIVTYSGLQTGDGLSGLMQGFADKNVLGAGNSVIDVISYMLADGNGGGNYNVVANAASGTITPASLTLNAATDSKTYDGTTASSGIVTYSGLQTGDSLSGLVQGFASKNVLGTNGSTLNVTGYTLADGNGGGNYSVVTNTASGTITPASLTISTGDVAKTYDGTIGAAGTAMAAGGTQLFGGDTLSGGSFAFTDKNVGAGKTVNVSGVTVNDGNGGGNYTVSYADNTASSIAKATLTLNAATDSKTYDGTQTSNGIVTYSGLQTGDSLSGLMQGFADKNVLGAGNSVIDVISYMLADGNGGGNYTVVANSAAGTIAKAPLTVTGSATASGKVYDGTTSATVGGTLDGVIGSDGVSLSGTFDTRNAGTGKTVTLILSGTDAGNYSLPVATTTADITPASLTVTANAASKTYDGNAYSDGNGVAYSGFVSGETAAVLGGTLAYGGNSQGAINAGSYAITPSGLTSGNYAITFANGTLTINPAPIVVGPAGLGVGADNKSKVYGSADPALTYTITSGALVGGDSFSGSLVRDAGENVGGYAIRQGSLTAGSNYSIDFTNGLLTINKAPLTVTANAVNKTYDGTTSAAGTAVLTGGTLFGADSLSGGSFAFTDKNAGTGKTVTVSGVTVNDGNGGGNYTVSYADNTASSIAKATLTMNAVTDSKTYDGTTTSGGTVTYSGLQTGDSLSGLMQGFASKNVLGTNGSSLNVTGYTLSDGNGGGNYNVVANSAAGTISPAALTVSTNAVTKTYDGTTNAAGIAVLTGGTLFGSDSISDGSFAFTDRNAGSNKTVAVSGVTINDGNSGNNYTAAYSANTNSTITPVPLTITANNAGKTYDGIAYSGGNGVTYSGFVNGETAAVLGGTLGYGGTSQGAVSAGSYSIVPAGLTSGNYVISFVDGRLTIAAAPPAPSSTVLRVRDQVAPLLAQLGPQEPGEPQYRSIARYRAAVRGGSAAPDEPDRLLLVRDGGVRRGR